MFSFGEGRAFLIGENAAENRSTALRDRVMFRKKLQLWKPDVVSFAFYNFAHRNMPKFDWINPRGIPIGSPMGIPMGSPMGIPLGISIPWEFPWEFP